MCDTLCKYTPDDFYFGKNSDRSPNEPNLTVFIPAEPDTTKARKCTYIGIEEQYASHAMLLVKPSWMWGAEMGVNDQSVMIGNEAVFTRAKGNKDKALIGMDLLRLGLEQGDTAKTAVDTIIFFLEKYGQGGNCGFEKPFYYDNSFLVADPGQAFILETSGKNWIVKEVKGQANISNRLSVNEHISFSSLSDPDGFARKNTEPLFTFFSCSRNRQSLVHELLAGDEISGPEAVMEVLRSHADNDPGRLFSKGSLKSPCMHYSLLGDHTTASMIVTGKTDTETIWLTGCSTPCLSLYKPTFFGQVIPPAFTNEADSLAYWLKREYLVRAIYAGIVDEKAYKGKLMTIQKRFVHLVDDLLASSPDDEAKRKLAWRCHEEEEAFVESYCEAITSVKTDTGKLPKRWRKKTQRLGMNVFETELESRLKG